MYIGKSELEAISVARDFISTAMESASDEFVESHRHIAKKLNDMEMKAIREIARRRVKSNSMKQS